VCAGLQLWLGSNLVLKQKDEYEWIFCISCARALFESYCTTSYWDFLSAPPRGTTIHVLRAGRSDRWLDADVAQLEAAASVSPTEERGAVMLHTLPDAGHWVHQDDARGLIEVMAPSLRSLNSQHT
jgi:pimeloyl-ACP methyl ester carboxylesterase